MTVSFWRTLRASDAAGGLKHECRADARLAPSLPSWAASPVIAHLTPVTTRYGSGW